jgi:hypothetical protein
MKSKKARKKINKIFKRYHTKEITIEEVLELLKESKEELEVMEWKLIKEMGDDYAKIDLQVSFEAWPEYLSYISDRWTSPYRVQWMLGLIDYLSKKEEEDNEDDC